MYRSSLTPMIRLSKQPLVLQRDFIQLTELGNPSLPVGNRGRMVAPLPVTPQLQGPLGVKLPLGPDPEQQHLHLGQGQARGFF
jgi:hypothetical protein